MAHFLLPPPILLAKIFPSTQTHNTALQSLKQPTTLSAFHHWIHEITVFTSFEEAAKQERKAASSLI